MPNLKCMAEYLPSLEEMLESQIRDPFQYAALLSIWGFILLEDFGDDTDIAYNSWMLKYPSALNSFDHIINRAKDKKIVIFLHYDGTLSPIVDDPDRAFMSADMHSAVKRVAEYFPTAIISGRSRDKGTFFDSLSGRG